MFYQFMDWIATYIECTLALAVVVQVGGVKPKGGKYFASLLLCAMVNFVLVTMLNGVSAFSFITPIVMIAFLFFVSGFMSYGKAVLRAASSIIVVFLILAVGYIWMISFCLIYGGEFQEAFRQFMTPSPLRVLYLVLDKTSDVIVYCIVKKHLYRLSQLKNRWLGFLFVVSAFTYILTQYIMRIVLSNDIYSMRQVSILSFSALLLFFVVFSILLLSISSRDQERAKQLMLQKTDQLMERNYQVLHEDLQENAKRMHDFHHHLRAIFGMAERANNKEIQEYVNSLLEISYRDVKLCHSGNDVIDAVINCSAAEAYRHHIKFQYDISLCSELHQISRVDLCAALGNQVENALEACKKVSNTQDRFVNINIRQKNGFLIICVMNSVKSSPFSEDGQLVSTKDQKEFHGLGIKSIQETVNKYNGYLKNYCENKIFVSEALFCISTV